MGRPRKHKPTREEIEFRNAVAASVILEHAAEYGDPSLPVQWARLWVSKHNLEKAMDGWHPKVLTLHDWNVAATRAEEEKEQIRRQRAIDRRRASKSTTSLTRNVATSRRLWR